MPEKIVLQDGTEREVPTADEIKALNAQATATSQLQEKAQTLEKELKEAQEGQNPNWKEMRQKMAQLESVNKQLTEQGKTIAPDGKIVDQPKQVSLDEVTKIASEQAQSVLVTAEKDKLFSQNFSKEETEVAERLYQKLATGETLTPAKVAEIVAMVNTVVHPPSSASPAPVHGGRPILNQTTTSETAKEIGREFNIKPEELDKASSEIKF